jgi:predicted nucleic acid-binding protein
VAVYAYLDSSALVKLAVREDETAALESDVVHREALFTSIVAETELRRAIGRAGKPPRPHQVDDVLGAVFLAALTSSIVQRAGRLTPTSLRTLDALHVATALSLDVPELEFITYDDRQADAARACGLHVVQPGRG